MDKEDNMLHQIITWILIRLHLRKRLPGKPAIETLMDLLPLIYATSIVLGAVKWLWPEGIHIPWYRRWWYWLKAKTRRVRAVVIGY